MTRPCPTTRPVVGGVTRESSLSSVVLPAPLGPMTPRIVPRGTLNVTFCSAHRSRFVREPIWYRLPSPFT